jgi:DNA anti-recombination protein RmuC
MDSPSQQGFVLSIAQVFFNFLSELWSTVINRVQTIEVTLADLKKDFSHMTDELQLVKDNFESLKTSYTEFKARVAEDFGNASAKATGLQQQIDALVAKGAATPEELNALSASIIELKEDMRVQDPDPSFPAQASPTDQV